MMLKRSVKLPSPIFYIHCFERDTLLENSLFPRFWNCDIIPSLTLVKAKSGYKPSNYAGCSPFLFGNDLCYFFPYSVLVLFMMLRMADFEINS